MAEQAIRKSLPFDAHRLDALLEEARHRRARRHLEAQRAVPARRLSLLLLRDHGCHRHQPLPAGARLSQGQARAGDVHRLRDGELREGTRQALAAGARPRHHRQPVDHAARGGAHQEARRRAQGRRGAGLPARRRRGGPAPGAVQRGHRRCELPAGTAARAQDAGGDRHAPRGLRARRRCHARRPSGRRSPASTKHELAETLRREEVGRGLVFDYLLHTAGTSLNRSPLRTSASRTATSSRSNSGGNYKGYIGDLCRMGILGQARRRAGGPAGLRRGGAAGDAPADQAGRARRRDHRAGRADGAGKPARQVHALHGARHGPRHPRGAAPHEPAAPLLRRLRRRPAAGKRHGDLDRDDHAAPAARLHQARGHGDASRTRATRRWATAAAAGTARAPRDDNRRTADSSPNLFQDMKTLGEALPPVKSATWRSGLECGCPIPTGPFSDAVAMLCGTAA